MDCGFLRFVVIVSGILFCIATVIASTCFVFILSRSILQFSGSMNIGAVHIIWKREQLEPPNKDRIIPSHNPRSLRFWAESIRDHHSVIHRDRDSPKSNIESMFFFARSQQLQTKTTCRRVQFQRALSFLPRHWALASTGHISSEGAMLANERATSSTLILTQLVYPHLTQPTYQEQIQLPKLNIPTSIDKISTHRKKKGFLCIAPTLLKSSVHLQGSVRISHYVVYCAYKMRYILPLLCSGTSTISTKFH